MSYISDLIYLELTPETFAVSIKHLLGVPLLLYVWWLHCRTLKSFFRRKAK